MNRTAYSVALAAGVACGCSSLPPSSFPPQVELRVATTSTCPYTPPPPPPAPRIRVTSAGGALGSAAIGVVVDRVGKALADAAAAKPVVYEAKGRLAHFHQTNLQLGTALNEGLRCLVLVLANFDPEARGSGDYEGAPPWWPGVVDRLKINEPLFYAELVVAQEAPGMYIVRPALIYARKYSFSEADKALREYRIELNLRAVGMDKPFGGGIFTFGAFAEGRHVFACRYAKQNLAEKFECDSDEEALFYVKSLPFGAPPEGDDLKAQKATFGKGLAPFVEAA